MAPRSSPPQGRGSSRRTLRGSGNGIERFVQLLAHPRWQGAVIFLAAFALYANTLGHGFVLDDGLVITDNPYVQRGFRGIPDILTHDSFFGTLGESANLSGGRYRPLSIVMFAAEHALFGDGPFAHHLINVLLYGLTAIVLLRWSRRTVFAGYPLAALAAVLLFVAHPVHTEVVANIKSRDEILSLLFIILTLDLHFRETLRISDQLKAAGCFALALLSKENGIILPAIAPLALFTFRGMPLPRALKACWPLALVAVLYLAVRFGVIGHQLREVPGVLDNPYVLATGTQKIATILAVLLAYVGLLLWPHPLTYDYSFAQVPYRDFGDLAAWGGGALLLVLLVMSARAFFRRDVPGWCALFFLATWLLVSGLFVNIGAPMAERFLYQASLPFIIAVVVCVRHGLARASGDGDIRVPAVLTLALCLPMAALTIVRNADWRDPNDLLLHDVGVSARSARANTYAGIACVRKARASADKPGQRELAEQALGYFAAADGIVPGYLPTLLNRGVACLLLDSVPAAEASWDQVRAVEPDNTMLKGYEAWLYDHYFHEGMKAGVDHDFTRAIASLEKAVRYGPQRAEAWYNLGGACFTNGDTARARTSWEQALRIDPQNAGARQGLGALGR